MGTICELWTGERGKITVFSEGILSTFLVILGCAVFDDIGDDFLDQLQLPQQQVNLNHRALDAYNFSVRS